MLFVSLQEVNALAVVNLHTKTIDKIVGLGFKDVSGVMRDYSDKDGGIHMKKFPVKMMFQPDTIATFEVKGKTYIASANEGDSQDYDGYSEGNPCGKINIGSQRISQCI